MRVVIIAILAACLARGNLRATDPRDQAKYDVIASRIDEIAKAISAYKNDHGSLPPRLRQLIPKYIDSERKLALPGLKTTLPFDIYLVWLGESGIPDPDSEDCRMVAFTSSEVPIGGRLIIDSYLQVWYCGEGRFQDWIYGVGYGGDSTAQPKADKGTTNTEQSGGGPYEAWQVGSEMRSEFLSHIGWERGEGC